MTNAINWHPNGTPGPWFSDGRLPGMSTYAVFNEQGVACVALCQAGCLAANGRDDAVKTNARAIAEVPAMVVALWELDSIWREFFPDGPDGKYGLVSIGGEQAATWRNICAILSRIDGGAA